MLQSNDAKWLGYRLGDIVKGILLKRKKFEYLDSIERDLPNSIAAIYLKKTKSLPFNDRINNLEILEKIVDEKSKNANIPGENDLVFHIRLGDVILDFKEGEVVLSLSSHGITIKDLKRLLKKVKKNTSADKVILIYGVHMTEINQEANDKYLKAIKEVLKAYGFEIEEKNSMLPDDDFIYMSNAKTLITTGGGFSGLAGKIVEKKEGAWFKKEIQKSSNSWMNGLTNHFSKLFPKKDFRFPVNDTKWLRYRIGRVVTGVCFKGRFFDYLSKIEQEFPDSIAGMYLERTKEIEAEYRFNNFEILESIIDEKAKNVDLPTEEEIVFHIRLGEVILHFEKKDVVFKSPNWGLTLKEIGQILDKIKKDNIGNEIILVYGNYHDTFDHELSVKYLAAIKKLIGEKQFTFKEKNTRNPDHDFVYICNSKKFIQSGRNYSKLAAKMVERKGGLVYPSST